MVWRVSAAMIGVTRIVCATIMAAGVNKMPKFEGILSQEAMWAIRSWLDTRSGAQAGQ